MIASKDELMKAFEKCAGGCDDDGCIYLEKANAITQKRYDNGLYCSCSCVELIAQDVLELLKEQQAEIERLQPKKGKWLECAGDQKCSECGSSYSDLYPEYSHTPFCPHCGARMEEGDMECQ